MKRTVNTDAITHDGHTRTIKQWSQRTGIPAFKIFSRLSLGWTTAKALSGPVVITFNGETLTIPEWSERTGLSELAIKSRLREGWTPERTLTHGTKAPTVKRPVITYDGETLPLTEWSARTGIAYGVLNSRLASNWTPERILTTPVKVRAPTAQAPTQAQPGVVSDFAGSEGTGGGRLLQETPEISFSPKEQVKP